MLESHPIALTPPDIVENEPKSIKYLIEELYKKGENIDHLLDIKSIKKIIEILEQENEDDPDITYFKKLLEEKEEQILKIPSHISKEDIFDKLAKIYGEDSSEIKLLKSNPEENTKEWSNQLSLLAQGNILWEIDFSAQALKYEQEKKDLSPVKEELLNNYIKAINQRVNEGKENLTSEQKEEKIKEFKERLFKKEEIEKSKKRERASLFKDFPVINEILKYYNSIDEKSIKINKDSLSKLEELRSKIIDLKLDLGDEESRNKNNVLLAQIALEKVGIDSDESEFSILKGLEDQFPWWRDLVSNIPDEFSEIDDLIKNWDERKEKALDKDIQDVVGKRKLKKAHKYIKRRHKKKDYLKKKIPIVGYSKKRRETLDSLDLEDSDYHKVITDFVKFGRKNRIIIPKRIQRIARNIEHVKEGGADQVAMEKRQRIFSKIRLISVILQYQSMIPNGSFSSIGEKALRSDAGEDVIDFVEDIAFYIFERASDELLDNEDLLVGIKSLLDGEISLAQFIQGSSLESDESSETLAENYSPEIILELEELAKIENPNYMDGKTMFSNAIALAQAEGVEVFWKPPEDKIELNDFVADFLFKNEGGSASSYFDKITTQHDFGNDDLEALLYSADYPFDQAAWGMKDVYGIIYDQEISPETSMLVASSYLEFSLNEFSKTGEPLSPDLLLSHALVVNDGDMHRALWDLSNFNKFLTRSILNDYGNQNIQDLDSGFLYSQIFDDYVASSGLTADELFDMMPANRSNTEDGKLIKLHDPANIAGSNYHIYNTLAFLSYLPSNSLPVGIFFDESGFLLQHGFDKITDQAGWLLEGASDIGGILDDLPTELDSQIEVDQFVIIPISEVDENMDFSKGVFKVEVSDGKEYFAVLKGSNFRPYLLLSSSKEDLNNSVSVLEINEGLKNGENIEIESAVKVEESSIGPLLSSDIEHLDLESILTLHLYAKVPFDLKNFPISFEDVRELDSVLLIKMAGVDGLKDEVYRSIIDTLVERNDILSEYEYYVHREIAVLLYYYGTDEYPGVSEDEVMKGIKRLIIELQPGEELPNLSLILRFLEENNGFNELSSLPELFISQEYLLTEDQFTEMIRFNPGNILDNYLGENGWENVPGIKFDRVIEVLESSDQLGILSEFPEVIISQNYELSEVQIDKIVENGPQYIVHYYLGENGWENVPGIKFDRVIEVLESSDQLGLLSRFPEIIISHNYELSEDQIDKIVENGLLYIVHYYLGENGWENVPGVEFSRVVEILESNGQLGLLSDYPELIELANLTPEQWKKMNEGN